MLASQYTSALSAAFLLLFVLWLVPFSIKWRRQRAKYKFLPCPPHDFWWGHMKIIGMAKNEMPPSFHYHQLMTYIGQKYDMPAVFYLDVWPLGNPLMIVLDPDVAYQITQAKSLPKHPINAQVLGALVGERSVVTAEGADWKLLRSILNPGFSTQYLSTLVPLLIRHGSIFKERISQYARMRETFPIQETATGLTIDVIGEVVLGTNFNSQRKPTALTTHFQKAVSWAGPSSDIIRWNLSRLPKFWHCWHQDRIIEKLIRDRYAETRSTNSSGTKAAVDLFLQAYREEKMGSLKHTLAKGGLDLDPEFMLLARNNVKTLLLGEFVPLTLSQSASVLTWIRRPRHDVNHHSVHNRAAQRAREPRRT